MQTLPRAAVLARSKMLLVVAAHLRSNAGNVVSPTRQNLPHQGIDALLTHICGVTAGLAPRAPIERLASPGCGAGSGGSLTRARLLPGEFQEGYFARKDAQARYMPHLHHSRLLKNLRGPRWKGGRPGSSLVVSPTRDTVRRAAFPDRGSIPAARRCTRAGDRSHSTANTQDRSQYQPSLPQPGR